MKSKARVNQHNLQFTKPVTTWDEAIPLGNGLLGALIWGDGLPLRVSLDRTDLWDLRSIPEYHSAEYKYDLMQQWHLAGRIADLERVYEAPYNRPMPTKIPAGRLELDFETTDFLESDLQLHQALSTTKWADGSGCQIFLHATESVGCINILATKVPKIRLIAPAFSGLLVQEAENPIELGDLAQLGYEAAIWEHGSYSQAFVQHGASGFSFAVFIAWQLTTQGCFAVWSISSSFEHPEPLTFAKTRVEKALQMGFTQLLESHTSWWANYWQQSGLALPNQRLERQWYLEQYKFGAAARRGTPPISLQGPWTADNGKLPPWKGDYHHDLNTQLSYWLCYASNHLEGGLGFLDWLWDTREACFAWTQRFYGLPGLNVPMTADLQNNQIGGWRQYTHLASTSAWLAHHFYLHWRYSMDRQFLADKAFVYICDVATFLEAVTRVKDTNGRRTLALSASPEINNNRPEAWFSGFTNFDLTLIRWLFSAATELALELADTSRIAAWQEVLLELPELARGENEALLIAPDYPLPHSHRHFSHLLAIHPLGVINWQDGSAAQQTIRASLAELDRLGSSQWCGYSFSWLASLKARAFDGAGAEQALEIFSIAFTLQNSFHCNGDQSDQNYSLFKLRPFTLEGNFAAAAGIQEMLLQSHGGIIRVFPAIPETWTDLQFWRFRAEGAILVSAERSGGIITQIELCAEQDCSTKIYSPFTGKIQVLQLRAGQVLQLGQSGEIYHLISNPS